MTEIVLLTIGLFLALAFLLAGVYYLYNKTYTQLPAAVKEDPATAFSAFGRTTIAIVSAAVSAFVAAIVFALTKQGIMKPELAAPIFAAIIGYVAGATQTFVTSRPR